MKLAIIFAAGIGKRLQPLTHTIHKSLIKFQGLPLIEHTIKYLLELPDLSKIIVMTGYKNEDFNYLTSKYKNLTLINNPEFLKYSSGYALKLVANYFDGTNDILIISGDMVSTKNPWLQLPALNCMAAITRIKNDKTDWCYQLNNKNNIIDIIKSDDVNSLLAGEWTYITKSWVKIIGIDLKNQKQALILQSTMLGKYLINNSIIHSIPLQPYILNYDNNWDLDNELDFERTKQYF